MGFLNIMAGRTVWVGGFGRQSLNERIGEKFLVTTAIKRMTQTGFLEYCYEKNYYALQSLLTFLVLYKLWLDFYE